MNRAEHLHGQPADAHGNGRQGGGGAGGVWQPKKHRCCHDRAVADGYVQLHAGLQLAHMEPDLLHCRNGA